MWPIVPSNKVLIGPCKTKIPSVGKMDTTIKTQSGIVTKEVSVVSNLKRPILSIKDGVSLKLIQILMKLLKLMTLMGSLRK